AITLAAVSSYGIWRLESVSYMVDDIPKDSRIMKDLHFFEANFSGIMPLEIVVEFITERRRPILEVRNMQKVARLEDFIDSISVVSKPVSIISLIKASKQAFYNNNPDRYSLPNSRERAFILRYLRGQRSEEHTSELQSRENL